MSSPRLFLEQAGDKLPSPSGVALAIMEIWDRDDTTVEQLSHLIQTDPALSGRILKLANSAVHGNRPVVAIPEAVVRIGMRTVGQVAVTFSLIENAMEGQCEAFDYQRFWSRGLLMALLSRGLAEVTALSAPDELFACGLLSRIGELAFATVYPRQFSKVIAAVDNESPLAQRTRREFGCDHCELSCEIMLDYKVPSALAEPARYHEDPDQCGYAQDSRPYRLAALLYLAFELSERALSGETKAPASSARIRQYSDRLGISAQRLEALLRDGIEEWHEWSKLLELPSHFEGDVSRLVEDAGSAEQAGTDPAITPRAVILAGESTSRRFKPILEQASCRVLSFDEEEALLKACLSFRPQYLLVDALSSSSQAARLCRLLRTTDWGAGIYITVLVGQKEPGAVSELFHAGADAVIGGDISDEEFSARLVAATRYLMQQQAWQDDRRQLRELASELSVSQHKFEALSLTDQLTLLPNRRAAMQALDQAWSLSERAGADMSVVVIDIDHFKSINDRFGHDCGDAVLRQVGTAMREAVRKQETICRLGGEEFLLISPASDLKSVVVAAERLRASIGRLAIKHDGQVISPTISLGVATRQREDDSPGALLSVADKAMYFAKQSGRDCVAFRNGAELRTLRKR